ncbi:alpha/beta hydrolase [Microbacterium sp. SORGH_AS_0888]|uniref:alpha/beta hydrolase n=1 Tax=Microbacterium sp. SORGH_AS_0888 TaxID=3041791 RepID=UPI00278627DA|nr:alpha/beta hydrolase [Microbacterium sp. SORGH_AS_0888]MDQ1128025.1 acetyl esterase/lipase [Microbacterium sp. SORGH_AS_0888]
MTLERIDPELRAALAIVGGSFPPTITPELVPFMRRSYASGPREELLAERAVDVRDLSFAAADGVALGASIVSPRGTDERTALAGILAFHSGGLMFGDRFSGMDVMLSMVEELGLRLITIDYRLAPEHPYPVPAEDCYAALEWVVHAAAELGVDPRRLLICGASAGAGLAAAVALLARDRDGPRCAGLLLDYPMLDDRCATASMGQFDGVGVWDRVSNMTGWRAYLGERAGTDEVPVSAAPGRAEDLRGLPPTYLDVGTAEVFRDETVAFAARLWAAGVPTELHVWPGAFHACDIFAPHTTIARAMIRTRREWVERMLVG